MTSSSAHIAVLHEVLTSISKSRREATYPWMVVRVIGISVACSFNAAASVAIQC